MQLAKQLKIISASWVLSVSAWVGAEGYSWEGHASQRSIAFQDLEFNGVLLFGERSKFAFLDKTSGKTFWVRQGETFGGLLVKDFDEERGIAQLQRGDALQAFRLAVSSGPVSTYDIAARNRDRLIEANLAMDMAVAHESRRQRLKEKRSEERERRAALENRRKEAALE